MVIKQTLVSDELLGRTVSTICCEPSVDTQAEMNAYRRCRRSGNEKSATT